MIKVTFDLTEGFSFDGEASADFGIRFVNGENERAYPSSLSFGYDISVNGETVDTHVWPPENITIRELSRNRVFPYRLAAKPDDEIGLKVWAENAGLKKEAKTFWTIPRPPQQYPSWTWENGAWVAPVPYPDTEGLHEWDEQTGSWVETGA